MAASAVTYTLKRCRPEDGAFKLDPRTVRVVTGERGGEFWELCLLCFHLRENQENDVFRCQVKTLREYCYPG